MTSQARTLAYSVLLIALGCASTPRVESKRGLTPSADTTIFAESGELGNGSGPFVFVGTNSRGNARRGLIRFDLDSIPPGSRVTAVSLTMSVTQANSARTDVRLHRVLESWGEGSASAQGGRGAEASPEDATWTQRGMEGATWSAPGGTIEQAPSASVSANQQGLVAFATPGMVSDVEEWLNDPSSNHGWLIVGEEQTMPSAKRFGSRENPDVQSRPGLTVEFVWK